eukprot:scaffold25924_cov69-Cyclotella_meneghiniana.AAC.4
MLNNVLGELRGVRVPDRRPYPKEMRELVIQMILNGGIEAVKKQQINILRAQKQFPSLKKWLGQNLTLGNIRPLRQTGNQRSEREIKGEALYQLALYKAIKPHAYLYEVKAYLHDRFPNSHPYSDSQIVRAEKRLGLSRKASSQTTKEAYTPTNLAYRKMYWERNYPLGIASERTDDMIDIDEAGFKLKSGDRSFGKVVREFRCNIRGQYKTGVPGSRHRVVFRAPYWSCDGAIEYVFNTIHTYLEMDDGSHLEDANDLTNKTNLIIASMGSFRRYFLHVGFQDN